MRDFPPALLTLLDQGRVAFAGMIRVDLGEGSFGIINGPSNYVFGGVTYKAVPRGLVSVSSAPATTGTVAAGFQVELVESPDNGVTPAEILNFEIYDYVDRPITVYDLHTHPDTGAILGDPVRTHRGRINHVRHETGERGHIMTLECETRAIDFSRMNGRQNNSRDLQRISATDKLFDQASAAGVVEVKWGRK